jgi:hypothetical protein
MGHPQRTHRSAGLRQRAKCAGEYASRVRGTTFGLRETRNSGRPHERRRVAPVTGRSPPRARASWPRPSAAPHGRSASAARASVRARRRSTRTGSAEIRGVGADAVVVESRPAGCRTASRVPAPGERVSATTRRTAIACSDTPLGVSRARLTRKPAVSARRSGSSPGPSRTAARTSRRPLAPAR